MQLYRLNGWSDSGVVERFEELERRFGALTLACDAKEQESHRLMKSMESRHEEATDQLSQLYQRKLSYESDRAWEVSKTGPKRSF